MDGQDGLLLKKNKLGTIFSVSLFTIQMIWKIMLNLEIELSLAGLDQDSYISQLINKNYKLEDLQTLFKISIMETI